MGHKWIVLFIVLSLFFASACSTIQEKTIEILKSQVLGGNSDTRVSSNAHTSNTQITTRESNNINIRTERYDSEALDNYFESLKNAVQFISGTNYEAAVQTGWLQMWSGMVVGKMRVSKIEVEEWPLQARKEGWQVMGSRIEKYNKIFEENRNRILSDERYDQALKTSLQSLELLTEKNMLADGQQFVAH